VQLHPGAAVTTFKNVVDRVVTEYGVAELRGSTIRERTRKLIGIAIRRSATSWSVRRESWVTCEAPRG
jgi:ABC-type tungstate transport system substrate-binding protein